MKILIVDDSRSVHTYIKSILGKEDYEFFDSFNGNEALATVENLKIDIILLDWEMPELNGKQTLDNLRAKGISTPIIMVTSKNSVECINDALSAGANEYVMKPFTRDILMEKIANVLNEADFI